MLVIFVIATVVFAQNSLDPRPLDPEKDPDIDLFMGSWQNSIPYNTHGSITERFILKKCTEESPLNTRRKGAVLKYANRFSRGHLDAWASTPPFVLKGEQEVLYITSGNGVIKTEKTVAELLNGIFVLIPEGLEVTITNTGSQILTMYIINEPVPEGFRPNVDILVKDEKRMPNRKEGFLTTHWSHNGKNIFGIKMD